MKEIEPLVGLKEVSEITKASPSTIYRFRKLGTFPEPLDLFEKKLVWKQSDIDDWLNGKYKEKRKLH